MIACVLSILLSVAPAAGKEAQAIKGQIQAARQAYYEGRASDALPLWEKLLEQRDLEHAQRIEILRFRAFTFFVLHRLEAAADAWRALQVLDPTARVTPNEASPEFVQFFNGIVPAPVPTNAEAPPDTPDAQPTDPQLKGSSADPPGARLNANQQPASLAEPDLQEEVRGCGIVLCLVPFGVGQFANGSWVKGIIFSALQVGGLATNIGMYWGQSDHVPASEVYLAVQHAAFGVFAAALVAGILDAFLFP